MEEVLEALRQGDASQLATFELEGTSLEPEDKRRPDGGIIKPVPAVNGALIVEVGARSLRVRFLSLGELVRVGSSEAESEFPHESKKRLSAVISEPQAGQ